MSSDNQSWGTRVGLILAMAGNAVGLGNFLRFPVQAVQNGGGTFIIPYLVCFFLMGIPLLWIEWSTGRYGGKNGNHCTPFILNDMGKKRLWKYIGVFGIFTNIAVAAYYTFIESWTLGYVIHSVKQTFTGMDQYQVSSYFGNFVDLNTSTLGIPLEPVILYLICLVINIYILSKGLEGGVEKVAKIGMPLLIAFGAFLAIRGLTLGDSGSPAGCADCDAFLGLDFLWKPDFSNLWDAKVWLAAAGQIFFTLSVGMGTIHCYAAYVKPKDDVALNAMAAGWMNGFVEIVLGASIVIPIAVGYLGLDWLKENASFSMAFQTMPYLFGKWGTVLATVAGFMWFGLLFFAGITSSLAMGTPWMGFMQDEFGYSLKKAAWSFGLITLIMGLPTVIFFNQGVFDQYDYWAGTVVLVVFALAESILFGWVFGITKGWNEINDGADIKLPKIYKPILKYITPTMLIIIFMGSLILPQDGDWEKAFKGDWQFDEKNSIIGQLGNNDIKHNRSLFSTDYESDYDDVVVIKTIPGTEESSPSISFAKVPEEGADNLAEDEISSLKTTAQVTLNPTDEIKVKPGDIIRGGDIIAAGWHINPIFYRYLSRVMLLGLFVYLAILVRVANKKRKDLI
ncbi:sodium-dependent transporter [Bacteroidia bacterium]|nr:sodium-dependent transporter [Bacteroidia bacterium]